MIRKKHIVTLGVMLLFVAGVSGCGINRKLTTYTAESAEFKFVETPLTETPGEMVGTSDTTANKIEAEEAPQLTALADSLEEAQEIADLYGIELERYSYGVASYCTDKDISELLNMGMEKGYPTLAPNTKLELNTN